ncbi:gonadotropin-releasing hormone II receptor-like [Hypanus sabinus]|uniref:gonadotropin-releasing hormone II receptor-like n=1 Tax=Hypanus sabinus TaxID=79690 RepID=UPI0028C40C88|nr:gonadotropin-releasing hormone II receptor-like [Hypanus sabinus]
MTCVRRHKLQERQLLDLVNEGVGQIKVAGLRDIESQRRATTATFSTASKVRVVIALAIILFSSYLNLSVLCDTLKRKGNGRSHIRTLIVNLSCADLLVTFIVMPLDASWNITVQWLAGSPACKLLMFLKLFSMYSCAVVISLDCYCAILRPLDISRANERNHTMLIGAWLLSGALATPQVPTSVSCSWFEVTSWDIIKAGQQFREGELASWAEKVKSVHQAEEGKMDCLIKDSSWAHGPQEETDWFGIANRVACC